MSRRAAATLAVVLALPVLAACSQQQAEGRVDKAQQSVEHRRESIDAKVDEHVTPHLPGVLRDADGYDAEALQRLVETTLRPGLTRLGKVGRAVCPHDGKLSDGLVVPCTLTVDGTPVPVRVTVTEDGNGTSQATAAVDAVVISGVRVAQALRPAVPAGATVVCGKGGLVAGRVGQSLSCELVLGAQTTPVSVTIKDDAGRVDVAPLATSAS